MFLSRLIIENFRCIGKLDLSFIKGVNTIIGENNCGKTTIIDAIRLILGVAIPRKEIYVSQEDFHIDAFGTTASTIKLTAFFIPETEIEKALLYELLVIQSETDHLLQLTLSFSRDKRDKIRMQVWGGEKEGQPVTTEALELLQFVYLNALRDAENALRPCKNSRIGALLENLSEDSAGRNIDSTHREQLAKKLDDVINGQEEWTSLKNHGEKQINDNLENMSLIGDQTKIKLDFLPYDFRGIVNNLQMQVIVNDLFGDQKHQLSQNGLGYNNLLYIATILEDLVNRKSKVDKDSYFALLIEEPEAHLHPQLQALLFEYINTINDSDIQVFITSHSPTLTAKVDISSLLILHRNASNISVLPIRNSPLDDDDTKFLTKFLDVTKSQLLFAKGVILVEGISEALLLPELAKKIDIDLCKSGVELVNLGGTSFSHFGKLYNSSEETERLSAHCSIISDDDREADGTFPARVQNLKRLPANNLKVFLAETTFEYELYLSNPDTMETVYRELHPQLSLTGSMEEKGHSFVAKLNSNKDKSELAYRLTKKLSDELIDFTVPEYLQEAIRWSTPNV